MQPIKFRLYRNKIHSSSWISLTTIIQVLNYVWENISREEYHYIQYHYIESTINTHVYTIMANCSYIKYLSLKMDEMMQSINFLLKEIENVG